jgi:hypothetical protein
MDAIGDLPSGADTRRVTPGRSIAVTHRQYACTIALTEVTSA